METINFGSFPRSGNHFFVAVANKLLVNTNVSWHKHKIFYLLKQKNAVTTIRNPIEAVQSLCFHTGEIEQDFIDSSLKWYKMYYTKVKQSNVLVVPFAQLINNPFVCFDNICRKYNLNENIMFDANILDITGKEYIGNTAPTSLTRSILGSKMLYDASSLFGELCD